MTRIRQTAMEPLPGSAFAAGSDPAFGAGASEIPKRGSVVFVKCSGHAHTSSHDTANKASVARHLCALLGMQFAGDYVPQRPPAAPLYFVPSHTLHLRDVMLSPTELRADRFFGGFVPHPFVASKLITHPLVNRDAPAPQGWSHEYGECIRDVVLPGRSVFTADDARLAADELLAFGPVRVKEGDGVGGIGQSVISRRADIEEVLGRIDAKTLLRKGLVLEQDLASEVVTCSVGQVQVGRWIASYYGDQRLTRNGRGHSVYGGSTLTVVLGDLESLPARAPNESLRIAAQQALVYHREAFRCFPGLVASRCNYDVVQGRDAGGQWRSGVLEQSWRIGGASGAEIAALHAFQDQPGLPAVQASTVERYGDAAQAPAGALVHFDGVDQHGDRLIKYVEVEPLVDVR